MSTLRELSKEKLLHYALNGCRAVLEKELGIKQVVFSMAASVRKEIQRRAGNGGLEFPYSFVNLVSIAAESDRQNNYAVKKHGVRMNDVGQRATTGKAYLFPIALGLEFHYIHSDPEAVLSMAQALAVLSLIGGLSFRLSIGDSYLFDVALEIPRDTSLNLADANNAELPGAIEITVNIVMHTTIGFFRDVSAVKGDTPTMQVQIQGEQSFEFPIQPL